MGISSKKRCRTLIHTITGKSKSFREYENIISKGGSPSLEEGIAALKMGRAASRAEDEAHAEKSRAHTL